MDAHFSQERCERLFEGALPRQGSCGSWRSYHPPAAPVAEAVALALAVTVAVALALAVTVAVAVAAAVAAAVAVAVAVAAPVAVA
eukprot:1597059-Pyramimonas_sp.AAC.1